jgi:hypothetical protein
MGFRLTVTKGKSEGKEFSFTKNRVRVGRNHDNDLVLYDLNVSRHHFEIVAEGSKYSLKDCGSQNGTRVNDAPAVDAPLRDGDRIQLGGIEFEFAGSDTQPHFQMTDATERAELFAPQSTEQRIKLEAIRTSAVSLKQLKRLKEQGIEVTPANVQPQSMHKKKSDTPTMELARDVVRGKSTGSRPKHRDLGQLTRRILYPLTGFLVGGLILGVWLLFYKPTPKNLSHRKFTFSADLAGRSFGAGRVDVPTPDKAQFAWISQGGRTIVRFTAGGIEREGEVAIALNGEPVISVPVTGQAWGGEVELKLDRKKLRAGEENVIAFVHRPSPGEAPRWGVRDVSLQETPLPPPSFDKAVSLLRLADEAMQNKKIAPSNLASAEDNYRLAILLMEGLDPLPPEHSRAEASLKNVQQELKAIMDSKLFLAASAKRLGQIGEAEATLRELLLYFPREDDPRRQTVEERLNALQK